MTPARRQRAFIVTIRPSHAVCILALTVLAPSGLQRPRLAVEPASVPDPAALGPAVTVVSAARREIVERAVVTGTLVPRDEILVAPEVEGLRITELLVEEGDRVAQGQVLARLSSEMIATQEASNVAAIARAEAAIIGPEPDRPGRGGRDRGAALLRTRPDPEQDRQRDGGRLEQRASASQAATAASLPPAAACRRPRPTSPRRRRQAPRSRCGAPAPISARRRRAS